ncbi:hypothetical protein [uncultured Jatrophihabitans sp.]|uniref:hypothetical protein n=1 Tax=uncultured Jatrophihabitans sp. TaxID=1610747 RepID=UPI0035C9AACB
MATIDRIDTGYTAWTPSSAGIATEDDTYVGRHRRSDAGKTFSLHRMFYTARHRSH